MEAAAASSRSGRRVRAMAEEEGVGDAVIFGVFTYV
jgi:hypothetical protein